MSEPIKTKTYAALWVDHHQASLMPIGSNPAQAHRVKAHEHPTAQHGSEVRSEHEFFAEVCSSLDEIDAVMVTGSKTALSDFRHYVAMHRPHVAARVAGYEVIDRPTDNQLAAMGRGFFDL